MSAREQLAQNPGGVMKYGTIWELTVVEYVWHVRRFGGHDEVVDRSCTVKDIGLSVELF